MSTTVTERGAERASPVSERSTPTRKRTSHRVRLRRDWPLLLMLTPGIVYFLVFHYGAIGGNVIAFKDYVPFIGIADSPWTGLANFRALLADGGFWHAALNTVEISALQLIFYFPVPLALALVLHSVSRNAIRKWVQSVVYLPHFISWVIVVALFQQMLGGTGLLNGVLGHADLGHVAIIGDPAWFKPLVVAEVVWKEAGWGTIIFLAALHQIDDQHYEASAIDGAGLWRQLWHVTLPALRPVIILLLILRLGDILSLGFEQFILQRDAVGPEAGEVVDTFVYYSGVVNGGWGFATTAGLFKGLIGVALVYTVNKIAHRLGEQGVYR